jgi:hypothetical protein
MSLLGRVRRGSLAGHWQSALSRLLSKYQVPGRKTRPNGVVGDPGSVDPVGDT